MGSNPLFSTTETFTNWTGRRRSAENLSRDAPTTRWNRTRSNQARSGSAECRIQFPSVCSMRSSASSPSCRSTPIRAAQRTVCTPSDRTSGIRAAVRSGSHRAHIPGHFSRPPTKPNHPFSIRSRDAGNVRIAEGRKTVSKTGRGVRKGIRCDDLLQNGFPVGRGESDPYRTV